MLELQSGPKSKESIFIIVSLHIV